MLAVLVLASAIEAVGGGGGGGRTAGPPNCQLYSQGMVRIQGAGYEGAFRKNSACV